MPKFSAFTPFGHLRFSASPAPGEVIYDDMVRNSGGETNISTEFDDSPVNADLYCESMQLARAKQTVMMAGEQYIPLRAVPMLPKLEKENGVVPGPKDSIRKRQKVVSAEAKIARGAHRENVETVLRGLLGDDFVAILPTDKNALVESSNSPETVGNWKPPGSRKQVYKLLSSVALLGVPTTRNIKYIAGDPGGFEVGSYVLVDVGDYNRTERVLVTAATSTSFTATYTKPHNNGTLVANGRLPNLASTKRHSAVVLSESAAADPEKRRIANRALRKLLRGVSTWSIVADGTGPFLTGGGSGEGLLAFTATQALP